MERRSRREIELSFDLPHLNPKVKPKDLPLLAEKELRELAEKCQQQDKT